MPSLRDLRNRIKSVKNTGQITRAMQLVAASKMKRAQERALSNRPYSLVLGELMALVEKHLEGAKLTHPLLEPREVKTRGILLVSTDRGLCGALNSNLFRKVIEITEPTVWFAVGRKGSQFLARSRRKLVSSHEINDKVPFSQIRAILEDMLSAYEKREIDSIEVLYPRFVNTMSQSPEITRLLPASNLAEEFERFRKNTVSSLSKAQDSREVIFEPDLSQIIGRLIRTYLRIQLYHDILEARASEYSARMVAMKTATDNAKKVVDTLTIRYNKQRQANITQEILEIAAASLGK